MALTKRGGFKPGGGRPKGSTTGRGVSKTITFKQEVWEAIEREAKERYTTPLRFACSIIEEKLTEIKKGSPAR
jgi:hypothetical protein